MFLQWRVLLCVLALSLHINKSFARSSHTYPTSGGLSGNDQHGYPSSGGSSGGNYGYPSSGYNSTVNNYVYATAGVNNGYNSSGIRHNMSGGASGYPSYGDKYNRPSKMTEDHLSRNTLSVYKDYYYSPPKVIKFIPAHGGNPIVYPVSKSPPPIYVYQIKDSGSKYANLLAGLALLNLGTISSTPHVQIPESINYTTKPGEVCLFGVAKDGGDYEETKIDCQIMSSFIIHQEMQVAKTRSASVTTTMHSTSNVTPVLGNVLYAMLPNGTLVPVNTSSISSESNVITSPGTTTITTNVTNALDVKGEPIVYTSGMKCYVVRTTPKSRMKKFFACRLLQAYAEKSIIKNSAVRNGPAFMILFAVLSTYLIN